ncbi:MAG: lipoyl(octanoyl) transferase LipB [Bacillota bacterium]
MVIIVEKIFKADYKKTWDYMENIADKKKNGLNEDYLLLVEHNPVYTIGRDGNKEDLLVSDQFLQEHDIRCYNVNRGGKITYHGPGQLVGYPILNLNNFEKDILIYLKNIEKSIIKLLDKYGIEGRRNKKMPGVWIGNDKICAIGIGINKWVTRHGFALNVNTDLNYFNNINPCGFVNKGVTSIYKETGNKLSLDWVMKDYLRIFSEVFNIKEIKGKGV